MYLLTSQAEHDTWLSSCADEDLQGGNSELESSGSEADQVRTGQPIREPAQPKAKPEVAHLGMQPKKALRSKAWAGRSETKSIGHESLSIAEQECLALEMLSRTKKSHDS